VGRVARAICAAACCTLGLSAGCATVVERSPEGFEDPWGQKVLADLLEAGLAEARPFLAGERIAVSVRSEDPAVAHYAARLAEEVIWSSGGRLAPAQEGRLLELEIRSSGRERSDRMLMVPLSQSLRLPLYYGQEQSGEVRALLRLRSADSARSWVVSGRRTGRASYAFRVLGPF
jgi:hypothetical protein